VSTSAHQLAEQQRLDQYRLRGHRGGVISMHRALGHFRLGPMNLLVAIALFISFSALWLLALPYACILWRLLLAAGLKAIHLDAHLDLIAWQRGFIQLAIPCLRVTPLLPDPQTWIWNCVITAAAFVSTYFWPKHLVPLIYLSRGILLIHASACTYFAIWPAQFPHTPNGYLEGLTFSSIAIITVVPLLFSLTYYIFNFGLWRKAFLTALTMTYLVFFVPFQLLFQAVFVQKTVLYMPVLYIVFAMPADVLVIVAFYAWGMTWKFRENPR